MNATPVTAGAANPVPLTATYRLQMRPDAFTFADAVDLVDYLAALGVSHLYLSPVLTAADGSTHGYDVVDPSTVSGGLGGRSGLVALAGAARARGMGLIVDIVPNHVGVADARQNLWWWDALRHGSESAYADFFDFDTAADNGADGKVALPVLASGDDVHECTVDRSGTEPMLAYYDKRFPIAPGTDSGTATEIHDRQSYRLVPWDSGLIGYRRFFTVSDLAAVRVEDPAVFDAVHAQVASWISDDLIDGVRVDHPDGLADPSGYLQRLRDLIGPDRWLVIEKILAEGEPLDATLPVDGTTGYDALNELAAVFVDPRGESELSALSRTFTGADGDAEWVQTQEHLLGRQVLEAGLAAELHRLVRTILRSTGNTAGTDTVLTETPLTETMVRDAVIAVVSQVPVYRADYAPLSTLLPRIVGRVGGSDTALEPALEVLVQALSTDPESAARFGQVCGAATAKAVEDCLFYRAARLISLQEVGGTPGRFGLDPSEFHLTWAQRARSWPRTMTTLSTHDTKRSEDVRARIGVLSQVPRLWADCVAEWETVAPSPDPAIGAFLWQTLFGVWPVDGVVTDSLRTRLRDYLRKALRENGTRTSWTEVDDDFEGAVLAWLDTVCDGPCGAGMSEFVAGLEPHWSSDALGQKLLQLLGPGIPDIYQGTELWSDSLVDPDNRRPVDYVERRRLLDAGEVPAKFAVVRAALRLRREKPASFVGGAYVPLRACGPAAHHVLAYGRGPHADEVDVVAVVSRHTVSLGAQGWSGTVLDLPPGDWIDLLTERTFSGRVRFDNLFAELPVAALSRVRPSAPIA
ncbi:malto-oligosyltrehalose synthase [Rhodococcus sp. F64268]|uniref:malto-oligosyltrehalose synthase n=1 Tax=Rhodococcus sp. F64268 TaxID=2926402 RepID=UPI001FF367A6|nr:malto-oligosyltrehalose synthase [Rhodococcus sp. F64268]MCK0092861.1 malto-oligosyltrehalose synthase [Rhodococcus sp. F64268]